MIAVMSDMGCKYLMRLQSSTFKGVKENPSSDFRIDIVFENSTYSVRVVRVILNTGEVETLITNLSEDEFCTNNFSDLYFLRWGIETVYDTLKNKLLVEKFAGRSTNAILQEYFAMMFILNCIAAMSVTVNRRLSSLFPDLLFLINVKCFLLNILFDFLVGVNANFLKLLALYRNPGCDERKPYYF